MGGGGERREKEKEKKTIHLGEKLDTVRYSQSISLSFFGTNSSLDGETALVRGTLKLMAAGGGAFKRLIDRALFCFA